MRRPVVRRVILAALWLWNWTYSIASIYVQGVSNQFIAGMLVALLASLLLLALRGKYILFSVAVGAFSLVVPCRDVLAVFNNFSYQIRQPYIWNYVLWFLLNALLLALLIAIVFRILHPDSRERSARAQ